MTLREVQVALRCISKRRHEESKFEAALHGVQLKSEVEEVAPPSEDRSARIDAHMRLAMAVKRREAQRDRG